MKTVVGPWSRTLLLQLEGVNMSWIRFSFTGVPLIFWSFLTDATEEVVESPSLSLACRNVYFPTHSSLLEGDGMKYLSF